MSEDVAILHDQLTQHGGAEHVAFELARTFDAPILAAAVDDEIVPADVEARCVFDRWWEQRAVRGHYLLADFCQMFGWQHVDDAYDFEAVILNKNNPGWFVPRDDQTVIKYCHSTPRQPYDLFHEHGRSYLSRALKTPMRVLYRPNITYPDAWACNSDLVQQRIETYWGIPSDEVRVIYPPVATSDYSRHDADTADYYFTISRLVNHKNIDDIIRAVTRLGDDHQLKIAGTGPCRDALERLADGSVEFLGYIDDAEKRRRYSEAKATIFAATNEDFGLIPAESMAAGTPVIGVRDGFTQYQILAGANGLLFDRGSDAIRAQIQRFEREGVAWSPERIEQFADQFNAERFRREMRSLVADAREATAIEPDLATEAADERELPPIVTSDGGDLE